MSLKKEIEDIRTSKDLPQLQIARNNIVKMSNLQKTIYKFNVISIKISTQLFSALKSTITNFILRNIKPLIAKIILKIELPMVSPFIISRGNTEKY